MSNIFRSRHELWLEEEVKTLRAERDKEITRLELAHATELMRAITENQSLRDELERTRLLLTPALQSVTLRKEQDNTPPPSPPTRIISGTPWQRVQANYFAQLEEQEKLKARKFVKPVDAPLPEGENNGGKREGRNEAPLGQQSTDA